MKKLVLLRDYKEKATYGQYIIYDGYNEAFRCKCIELPWLNNQHDISCIPGDIYDVSKLSTPNHPNCFIIEDVKDRDNILIHPGNFAVGLKIDTLGCQLPGLGFADINNDGFLDVIYSQHAMDALNYFLPDHFKLMIL